MWAAYVSFCTNRAKTSVASTQKLGAEIGKEAPGGCEREVPDEVVRGYLAILRRGRRDEGFPALLDRMSPRCDPDEDEALELCNEQLRAFGRKWRQTGR